MLGVIPALMSFRLGAFRVIRKRVLYKPLQPVLEVVSSLLFIGKGFTAPIAVVPFFYDAVFVPKCQHIALEWFSYSLPIFTLCTFFDFFRSGHFGTCFEQRLNADTDMLMLGAVLVVMLHQLIGEGASMRVIVRVDTQSP